MTTISALQKAQQLLARPIGVSAQATNSRNADKFVVRLPDGMREEIKESARASHRSMNSQVIDTLEMHLILEKMGHGPLLECLREGKPVKGFTSPAASPAQRIRAGDPVTSNDAVWIVDKLEVKGNVVYAIISRENPANSMPETKTVRYSTLSVFAE